MVLSVNTETITVDDIILNLGESLGKLAAGNSYEAFSLRAKPTIQYAVREKIIDILLYQQAKSKAPENVEEALDKAVEMEVNRFVSEFGNNYAQAHASIAEMGMDWKGFRDYQRKYLLVQSYISTELKDSKRVTHDELMAYYDSIKAKRFEWPGTLQFRVVDIMPEKLKADQIHSDQGETSSQAAVRIAQLLLEQIRQGEDFAELARQHSHDHRAALGGLWLPVKTGTGSLSKPYDRLETEAEKIEVGQTAGPIVTDGHVFLLYLTEKKTAGVRSFSEVQNILEAEYKILQKKKRYDDMLDKVIARADIREIDRFIDHCTAEVYRRYQMGEGKK
jgi:parvulin-like peptidyl-prolyl isomerase